MSKYTTHNATCDSKPPHLGHYPSHKLTACLYDLVIKVHAKKSKAARVCLLFPSLSHPVLVGIY